MASVLNAVFGIAIAVIIFLTVILGIKAIFPEPQWPDMSEYCGADYWSKARPIEPANETIEIPQCEKDYNAAQLTYEKERKDYQKIPFFISVIAGALLLIGTYFVWNSTNIAAGLACAGVALVIYGFMRGWDAAGDLLKFIMMLPIAGIVLFLASKIRKKITGGK